MYLFVQWQLCSKYRWLKQLNVLIFVDFDSKSGSGGGGGGLYGCVWFPSTLGIPEPFGTAVDICLYLSWLLWTIISLRW